MPPAHKLAERHNLLINDWDLDHSCTHRHIRIKNDNISMLKRITLYKTFALKGFQALAYTP